VSQPRELSHRPRELAGTRYESGAGKDGKPGVFQGYRRDLFNFL
jgi:hypothetical protein